MTFVLLVASPPSGVTTLTVIVSPALGVGLSTPAQELPEQVAEDPGLTFDELHVATTPVG